MTTPDDNLYQFPAEFWDFLMVERGITREQFENASLEFQQDCVDEFYGTAEDDLRDI